MELCFGIYAKILKLCCRSSVHNKTLVDALVKTIDPDSKYIDNDTSVSRLMNCTASFPEVTVSDSYGPVRSTDGAITNIVALARNTNVRELTPLFEESILPLLDTDKITYALSALQYVITSDVSLAYTHRMTFEQCMGHDSVFSAQMSAIEPSSFLAGLFLYTVLTNENKNADISIVDWGFIDLASTDKQIRLLDCQMPDSLCVDDCTNLYLDKVLHTYDKIKTLLYSEAPMPFYDFYVCNNIYRYVPIYKNNKRSYKWETIDHVTIEKLSVISSCIILSGTGGLGKSMMMRHLFLDATKRYTDTGIIPFFIQLKNYRASLADLIDFIIFEISSLFPGISRERMVAILESGNGLFLFDGLDEISQETAVSFQSALDSFINLYTDNQFIISSRPYGNFSAFTRFTVVNLKSFSKAQSLELIDKLDFRSDMPEIKSKFRKELDMRLYWSHRGFSDNPLLLTIMLMTFEEFAEVPSKMHIFYQEAYTVLSKKHDANKGGFRRALSTDITTDQFADVLARFCAITYKDEKFEFSWAEMDRYFSDLKCKFPLSSKSTDDFIFDVCSNLCVMYLESNSYSFIHRSFQEYFCARFFARQKDKNLERIGSLFEHNKLARRGDQTFQMLYDMIPEKVTEFILIPFLQKLIQKCDEEEGYHTFLRDIYGTMTAGDDYVVDQGDCSTGSVLYQFIIETFDISHERYIDADLIDGTDLLAETQYYSLSDDDEYDDEIVEESDIPSDFIGSQEEAGKVYELDWDEIFDDPTYYEDLIHSIDCVTFPLNLEYENIRSLCQSLVESITHDDDEDLFDILD